MFRMISSREYLTRPLVCAANLSAVLSGTTADDRPVALKSRWQFNKKRGAILLMHRPRLICVHDEFFDEQIVLPILKNKVIVEQVYSCPGFYMYLSNKSKHSPILRAVLFR